MTLHAETEWSPREESTWQIAMRSFPPALRSPGNPGARAHRAGDEFAMRSVPSLVSARNPDLWPVGSRDGIIRYVDNLLDELSSRLWGGRPIPRLTVETCAGDLDGAPLTVEVAADALDLAAQRRLQAGLDAGWNAFSGALQDVARDGFGTAGAASLQAMREALPEGQRFDDAAGVRQRAIEASVGAATDLFETLTADGVTDSEIAAECLRAAAGVLAAIAPALGGWGTLVAYVCAALLYIASVIADNWDRLMYPAEEVGHRSYWSTNQKAQVLRYRMLILTCAKRENLDQISRMSKSQLEFWLERTSRMVGEASDLTLNAHALMGRGAEGSFGDPLNTSRLIAQIRRYLKYAGASPNELDKIDGWLWDARRISRILEGRESGEINPGTPEHRSVRNIADSLGWWTSYAYGSNAMAGPERFGDDDLIAVHSHLRGILVSEASSKVPLTVSNQARLGLQMARSMRDRDLEAINRSRAGRIDVVVREYALECYPDFPAGGLDDGPASRSTGVRARRRDWTCVAKLVAPPPEYEQRTPTGTVSALGMQVYDVARGGGFRLAGAAALGSGALGVVGDADSMGVNTNEIRSEAFRDETRRAIEAATRGPIFPKVVAGAVILGVGALAVEGVRRGRKRSARVTVTRR